MRFCVHVLGVLVLFVASVPAQTTPPPSWDGSYYDFLDQFFSHYDKDGNGAIDKAELKEMKLPPRPDGKSVKEKSRQGVGGSAQVSQQLSQLFGGKQGNMLGGLMASDGKITGDLLGGAISSKRKGSAKPIPKSVSITFVALELPENFARNDMVTLKEMASGLAGGVKETELEKIGIRLLDLYEFSVVDGMEARLNFEQAKQTVYDERKRSYIQFNLGSTLSATPYVHDQGLTLDIDYSTSAKNKNDKGVRQVGSQSRLLLTEKTRTKLVNLYNEGVHYLLIVSAKVQ